MKVLNPDVDPDLFYRKLQASSPKALLLDYDGTLAPFQIEPAKAFPYPGVTEKLNGILRSADTRLVIVTGRWIKDLLPLLRLERQPEVWGSHGLERLKEDGSYEVAAMDEQALSGLVAADEWITSMGLAEKSEAKPGCLALHWRGLAEERVRAVRDQVEPRWSSLADRHGLDLREFDGGLELRAPGRNKGDAVQTILAEMNGEYAAAYLGDDLTDEDAFRAIRGRGLGVLVREEFRATAADLWLQPPGELLAFLSRWLPET